MRSKKYYFTTKDLVAMRALGKSMRRKTVYVFVLIALIVVAGFVAYFKPWVTRIVTLYPEDASDIFNELKTRFESGNWLTEISPEAYNDEENLYEKLSGGGIDLIIINNIDTAEKLRKSGYINWFVEFANRSGSLYCIAAIYDSVHSNQALGFVRFVLENSDIYSKLCTVIKPARGFGNIPEELQPYAGKYRVVIDWLNRSVVLPEKINRIVSLIPVVTITAVMVGGGDLLVGVDKISPTSEFLQMVYPRIKEAPIAGLITEFDEEFILSLNPDVVFVNVGLVAERLERIGIPAVVISMGDLEHKELLSAIRLIGEVIGEEEKAEELVSYCKEMLNSILNVTSNIPRSERPKVYVALGSDGLSTHVSLIAKDTIWAAGGICVAENLSRPGGGPPLAQVSMESILSWNPDVIIAWTPKIKQIILSDPAWSVISAVKNDRVYVLPRGVREWIIPEPEAILGAKWLAAKLYPNEVSFSRDEIREFYSKFLNYTVSEEEINNILGGKYVTTVPGR